MLWKHQRRLFSPRGVIITIRIKRTKFYVEVKLKRLPRDAFDGAWFLCVFQRPVNDEKSPVGPWLLALFVFVVCGSGEFLPCRWYRCWYSCWCRRALLPAQLILSLWRFCRTLSALETLSHIFPQKFCLQPAGYGVRRSSCDRLHFYRCQSGLAISN